MSVYFACVKGYVKIGYSADPLTRMTSITSKSAKRPLDIKAGDSVDLLGWIPGDRDVERQMHMRFAHHYFNGEWFYDADDYDEFLASHEFAALPHELSVPELMFMFENPSVPRASVSAAYELYMAERRANEPAVDALHTMLGIDDGFTADLAARHRESRRIERLRDREELRRSA